LSHKEDADHGVFFYVELLPNKNYFCSFYVIASVNQETPKDTFVPLGKRNKQAKDKHFRF